MRNRCPDYCCSPYEGGGFMDDLRTKYPDIYNNMQRGLPQARPCVENYGKFKPPPNFSTIYKGGGRRLTKDFRPSTLEYRPSTLEYRGGGFKDFWNTLSGGIRRGIDFSMKTGIPFVEYMKQEEASTTTFKELGKEEVMMTSTMNLVFKRT